VLVADTLPSITTSEPTDVVELIEEAAEPRCKKLPRTDPLNPYVLSAAAFVPVEAVTTAEVAYVVSVAAGLKS
jgi:hypothetical protein